ncbi:hypothetical protein ABLE91_16680 [Aquabacter sp. CN5-332]|uniref:hypothetical protein n=1 Tax=Aquabacter sp. CN5-332 TaxID=3156608 RepID=UPI0032B62524
MTPDPGFVSGQRYHRHEGSDYLAVYEIDDLGTMTVQAATKVNTQPSEQITWMPKNVTGFTRYLANETSVRAKGDVDAAVNAPVLYAIAFNVPTEATAYSRADNLGQAYRPCLLSARS